MNTNRRHALLLVLFSVGCAHYTPYTSQQLAEKGTFHIANYSKEQAVEACATALATLGYKVTVKDPASGVIKTAPQSIMTSATGGAGYANVTDDGLAWLITAEASGADAVLHATPRGFRNGSEVKEEGMWVAEVMEAKFRDLWTEVATNVHVAVAR